MITNLDKRRKVWDNPLARAPYADRHDLTDSIPYPFEDVGIQSIFDGKDVLEMGPGRGRQYERLSDRTKSYCVADLSPVGLSEKVFANTDERYVLEDWKATLSRSFDVIHFWYVLHHVPLAEMQDFFSFVGTNLRQGGLVAFNCPTEENVTGKPEGDGFSTTYSDPIIVWEKSQPLEMLMAAPVGQRSTGYIFLLQKTSTRPRAIPPYFDKMVAENREKWRPKPPPEVEKVVEQINQLGQPITLIHFVFQVNPTRLACMPNMTEFGQTQYHPVVLHTNDSRAATCPACKRTNVYKTALGKHNE